MLKRLVNYSEERTNDRLVEACTPFGAHVCPKVRLADVVPIERSGIKDFEYSYALRAHLDFVVTDSQWNPLFAVEFDGPSHTEPDQQTRDDLKNQICKRFKLPLMRIDGAFLRPRYGELDLLSWLVGVVLIRLEDREAPAIPDEPMFDPTLSAPFVISHSAQERLDELAAEGEVARYNPSIVGSDSSGHAYGLAGVFLRSGELAVATADLPYQGFFNLAEELLEELLCIKVVQKVEEVFSGRETAWTYVAFADSVRQFLQTHSSISSSTLINPTNGEITRLG